jgi:membrane-associated phospholipid phosphatase
MHSRLASRATDGSLRSPASLACIAAVATSAVVMLYVLVLGTDVGRSLDAAALPAGLYGPGWDRAHEALAIAVQAISLASLAIVALGALAVAITREGPRLALRVGLLLAGANLTSHFLKPLLGSADPLGGERLRAIHDSFPSGHATVAMSVAYTALAIAPARWRRPCAVVASAYAAAVGVGLVMLHAHYPSDVIAGYLVATAWAALAVLATPRLESSVDTPRLGADALHRWRAVWGVRAFGAVAATGSLVAGGWALSNVSNLVLDIRVHTAFLASAAGIALFAATLAMLGARLLFGADKQLRPTPSR